MSIVVNCECGKQLRVPEQYAGKKVKCPSCGDPLKVAAGQKNGPSKKPVAVASKTAAAPPVIKFECDECGRAMQARSEFAGRKAKCPGCQTLVTIPEPEEEAETAEEVEEEAPKARIQTSKSLPRKAASKRPVDEDEDVEEAEAAEEAEEEDEKPRKSKRKKSVRKQGVSLGLVIGLGAAALLLLAGGAVALYFMLGDSNGPLDDLAMIPADTQGFVLVRVADLWKNPGVQELIPPIQKQVGKDFTKELQDNFGIDPGDIERFAFVMQDRLANKGWATIKTNKPFDKAKVTQKLELQSEPKKYQNKTYLLSKDGKGALHFAGDKMCVLASNEDTLKTALDLATGARKADSGQMATAVGMAKQNPQTLFAFQMPPEAATQIGMFLTANPGLQAFNLRPIVELRNMIVTLNLDGNQASSEVLLNYLNENKAKAAKASIDALKTNQLVLLMLANNPDAKKALAEMNVEVAGSDLKMKSSQTFKPGDFTKALAAMPGPGNAMPVRPGQPQNPNQQKNQPNRPGKKGPGVPR